MYTLVSTSLTPAVTTTTVAHMTLPEIVYTHALVEEILDSHRDHAGGDKEGYAGYRAHVYRVLNFARALVPDENDSDDKLAIAAAFHDLDVFSGLDYLAPSIRAQDAWLEQTGRRAWAAELAVVIAEHHRLTRCRGEDSRLADGFRRADLVDVSNGRLRSGIPRDYVNAVCAEFDVGEFFSRVIPGSFRRNLLRHPLDPAPFMRARRALKQAGYPGRPS